MIQPQAIPSYSHPRTTEKLLALIRDERFENKTVVDLGAGAGYFSWKLFEVLERQGLDPSTIITPCDLYPELFQFDKLQCRQCDFNDGLGFEPATVDLVVCMEVIEHIPNQLRLWQELARIIKPGGKALVTTPNILNINARLRYLFSGTMPLFDILPIAENDVVHTSGHINPVSLYYLYFFAKLAGFSEIRFHIDRVKRSAVALSPFFFVAAKLVSYAMNVRRRKQPCWNENESAVAAMNQWSTFVGRTIIIEAIR
ncbi:MAG: class I SAM-dependent methyltransferase [Planctomycetes bacterium]|nr:class I SAM-dependent methyltransferase [Planctomycetota bacterium]